MALGELSGVPAFSGAAVRVSPGWSARTIADPGRSSSVLVLLPFGGGQVRTPRSHREGTR